jgi:O-acetyl-ADP-ribose deacetylase (regulator of RNase III)
MFVFEIGQPPNPKYIINFPTKQHWRAKSRMEDIGTGLMALVSEIRSRRIRSIAIPPLGSGLGGLDWRDVRPRVEAALCDLEEVKVVIYQPDA